MFQDLASEPQGRSSPAANYCGLDLAGVSSYAYVTDENGRKLAAGLVATTRAGLEQLVKKFGQDGLSIAIEAENQTAWIYETLVQLERESPWSIRRSFD